MVDFSHLAAARATAEDRAEFHLRRLNVDGVYPVLIVAPAGQVNKPYFHKLLKTQARRVVQVTRNTIDADFIDDNRDEDRKLYPAYVIKGWRDVLDASGKEVPFNEANCHEFLQVLPDDMFDELRDFCSRMSNFRDGDITTKAEAKAKN